MFAKVFTQILDSSLADDYLIRLVFEDLLKLCDLNGVVDLTHEAISRRTNVPIDIVKNGIDRLEQPDKRSRTPDHDGKRIIRLDDHREWGWLIVNYDYYRNLASEDQRREKTLARVRKHREKTKDVTHCNAPVTHDNACNAMQMEKDIEKESTPLPPKRGNGNRLLPTTENAIRISKIFHRRLETPWSEKEVRAFKKIGPIDGEELSSVERYYQANWPPDSNRNILRHDLSTFLNNFRGEIDRSKNHITQQRNADKP